MDQIDIAIHQTVHGFGLPAMASKMGMREQTLRNKVNPTEEAHELKFREWLGTLDVSQNFSSLDAVCQQFGGHFVRDMERPNPRDLLRALLAADSEHGDVTRSIREALRDGTIAPREMAEILREIGEAVSALNDLSAYLLKQAGERV